MFNVKDREMINMFWEVCNKSSFCKHICQPDNFLYLNEKNVIYPRVAEIVMDYIEADENNFSKLKRKLIENQKIFQFVHTSVYPEVCSFGKTKGVDVRNNLLLKFKEWKDRKKYPEKLIDGYFSKMQNLQPAQGAVQKKLVMDQDFEEEKKIAEEQKQQQQQQQKMEEEKQKRRTQMRNCGKKQRT